MALDELMPADLLAEVQSRPGFDTYTFRLDYVCRRVAHHRTLAQRAKPVSVDPSGDALMAAMSVPASAPSDPLAATLKLIQEQLNALSAWGGSNGSDLDALGKGKGTGRKGGGKKGGGGGGKDGGGRA